MRNIASFYVFFLLIRPNFGTFAKTIYNAEKKTLIALGWLLQLLFIEQY